MAGGGQGDDEITRLPEGCISHVISLTSPRDCCRSAVVSTTFRSAAESDTVWDRFLPPDYDEILSLAADPVQFSSKRDLYFRLCDPVLLEGGTKSFALERSSGRKCYTLSARELTIIWGGTPHYWNWRHHDDSRFPEVAELLDVCWLEIRGRINCKVLSQKTPYAAYLIFKLAQGSHGFSSINQEASVRVGSHVSQHVVCLQPDDDAAAHVVHLQPNHAAAAHVVRLQPVVAAAAHRRQTGRFQFLNWRRRLGAFQPPPEGEETSGAARGAFQPPPEGEETSRAARTPHARDDGWMEMELGDFSNDDGYDGDVEMCLFETKGGHWKSGLILEGIEVRPKN